MGNLAALREYSASFVAEKMHDFGGIREPSPVCRERRVDKRLNECRLWHERLIVAPAHNNDRNRGCCCAERQNHTRHTPQHSFLWGCFSLLAPSAPVKYIIDDGTGLLPCTQYERNASSGALRNGHAQRHELGELLVVQGRLKRYRG